MSLEGQIRQERLAAYHRLRGGFPIPLAGATWWAALALAGYCGAPQRLWIFAAVYGSGLIFPLALLFARIFRCDFMKDRSAVASVLAPTFISMLLFWPIAISAWWAYPALFPLVLAIGLSLHWPVIGWSYGKTGIYTAHAVVRAAVCFYIWNWLPEARLTLLPAAVAVVYLATVLVILVDSARRPGYLAVPA